MQSTTAPYPWNMCWTNVAILQLILDLVQCGLTERSTLGKTNRVVERHVSYSIQENCPVGTEIGSLKDLNLMKIDDNVLFEPGTESRLFGVDPQSGRVKTIASIDSEALCSSEFVTGGEERADRKDTNPIILLNEHGKDSECLPNGKVIFHWIINAFTVNHVLKYIYRISIEIQDVDDNMPIFKHKTFQKKVKEVFYQKGRRITLPRAVDMDLAQENRQIQYQLFPYGDSTQSIRDKLGFPFELEIDQLEQPQLLLTQDLDAEIAQSYYFSLKAFRIESRNVMSDGYSRLEASSRQLNASRLDILIEVEDINDNEPTFAHSYYETTVLESAPVGTTIFRIIAHDPDITSNLTYRIVHTGSNHSPFQIDHEGYITSSGTLDYELAHKHTVQIEADDGEFTARTQLVIMVLDVNDMAPEFNLNPTNLTVSENVAPGKLIAQLRVSDKDSDAVNGQLNCWEPRDLQNQQPLRFYPSTTSTHSLVYDLFTRTILDREDVSIRLIVLVCSDGNGIATTSKQTSTLTTSLIIRDENDNSPVFERDVYVAEIAENNAIGDIITQVHARDPDEGQNANVSYYVLDEANFKIDPLTGWIMANAVFDREQRQTYLVTIGARDHGFPPTHSEVLLNLTILDVNDNRPYVIRPVEVYTEQENVFVVRENAPPDTYLGNIKAVDADIGLNGLITYELEDPWGNLSGFRLEPNGSLYAREPLDREQQAFYNLTVRIQDQGRPHSLTSTGNVYVWILDENDNTPSFVEPDGLVNLLSVTQDVRKKHSEQRMPHDQPFLHSNTSLDISDFQTDPTHLPSPPGTVVLSVHESPGALVTTLRATDLDSAENGSVVYSMEILEQQGHELRNGSGFVKINAQNGVITTTMPLNKTHLGEHYFVVQAMDRGLVVRKSETMVLVITVKDVPARSLFPEYSTLARGQTIEKLHLNFIISACVVGMVITAFVMGLACVFRSKMYRQSHSSQKSASTAFPVDHLTKEGKEEHGDFLMYQSADGSFGKLSPRKQNLTSHASEVNAALSTFGQAAHQQYDSLSPTESKTSESILYSDFPVVSLQYREQLNPITPTGNLPMQGHLYSTTEASGSLLLIPSTKFQFYDPTDNRALSNSTFLYSVVVGEIESDSGRGCSEEERFCDFAKCTTYR